MTALEWDRLQPLIQCRDLETLTLQELLALFRAELQSAEHLPSGRHEVDPRDGAVITYNPDRSRRRRDCKTDASPQGVDSCPICRGQTTGIVDLASLSDGYTFINKNLFPILRQLDGVAPMPAVTLERAARDAMDASEMEGVAYGLHFLQWTSTRHEDDWHTLPHADRFTALQRLAVLEHKLLYESEGFMPQSEPWNLDRSTHGYVSIIKNYGRAVGGSLSHGHQQIAFSNIMPRRFFNNWRFFERRREMFSMHLLHSTPPELVVRDYGPAVLLVPYFMRRPCDMTLVVKDGSREYLSDLTAEEITGVADGWGDAIRGIVRVMAAMGRAPAFNVTVNNGPGAGLYFDFLPYTQEVGGFEHLGLWICEDHPQSAAERLREALADEPQVAGDGQSAPTDPSSVNAR